MVVVALSVSPGTSGGQWADASAGSLLGQAAQDHLIRALNAVDVDTGARQLKKGERT